MPALATFRQPNVGKSSLLNAMVGKSKVRASKTPGKTKHFQTIFWTPEVHLRIVDFDLRLPVLIVLLPPDRSGSPTRLASSSRR